MEIVILNALEKARANGAKEIAGFTGGVRGDELNTLEKGDIFTVPEDYKVLEQVIPNSNRKTQYIIVDVAGVAKNFYPSSLQKNLPEYNEAGEKTGARLKTHGEVCDWFKKQPTIDGAMRKLKGCTLEITDITPGLTLVYGSQTGETRETGFMTVNYAAGSKKPE